jgi:subtilisin family serine protease
MQRIKNYLVALGIVTVGLFPVTTSGQLPDYPPEFSPLRTSRPAKAQRSLVPRTKFVKVKNAIPNRYIVVLNDDAVAINAHLEARRAAVTAIANRHALAHLGNVGYIYETALKGYSIELPSEAAAIAISNEPEVKWVEEDARLQLAQSEPDAFESNPPWGLDAIDGSMPAPTPDANGKTNGIYIYNATGAGVTAYVLDTGINTAHQEFSTGFFSRASEAADCIAYANCQSGPPSQFTDSLCTGSMPNTTNNDCYGHGTHVAGTLGGNAYGVAKSVTIGSVKVCTVSFGCPTSAVIQGVNWVTNAHLANASVPVVANMSLGGDKRAGYNPPYSDPTGVDSAVNNSIDLGVTYVVSAPDANDDTSNYYPADVDRALTVGSVDWTGSRDPNTGWGSSVDLFAPGVFVLSALSGNNMPYPCHWFGGNNESCTASGTSMAAPHVAGAVAMYLQGRTGTFTCSAHPIQGASSSTGGDMSTCPDRVARFIDANANLNKLSNINGTVYDQNGNPVTVPSPNRFLWTVAIPTRTNPIDNQRFYVWQQYADFLTNQPQPDEGGLNFWTSQINTTCGTGFNDNNSCTHVKRIDVSRAFWVAAYGSLFDSHGTTNNSQFVHLCYQLYLRRSVSDNDGGFQFWLNNLSNNYGNPASYDGVNNMIDAFTSSTEYRQRFGQ